MSETPVTSPQTPAEPTLQIGATYPSRKVEVDTYVVTPKGYNLHLIITSYATTTDVDHALSVLAHACKKLDEFGAKPKPIGQQIQSKSTSFQAAATPQKATKQIPVAKAEAEPSTEADEQGELTEKTLSGSGTLTKLYTPTKKAYMMLKIPPFSKIGVRIWPEVIKEAGWDIESFEDGTNYEFNGQAIVQVKLKANGKESPQKVIKLIPEKSESKEEW